MKLHRYVVFAEWLRGFDRLDDAVEFARANYPSILCERVEGPDGAAVMREVMRHDLMYDPDRNEWAIHLRSVFSAASH